MFLVDRVFLEGERKVRLSIDLEKDWFGKTVTYGYKLDELQESIKKKPRKNP